MKCNILLPSILFINTNLLLEYRKNWRFLYSSASHDKSLAEMSSRICYNGPTILVVKVCGNVERIGIIFSLFQRTQKATFLVLMLLPAGLTPRAGEFINAEKKVALDKR